jgi:dihydrofolate reductase/thymidylate synthase
MFDIVVAYSIPEHAIGCAGGLPWPRLRSDMRHFRALTRGHVVIMGRGTFESIGSRPLPERLNIVVSATLRESSSRGVTTTAVCSGATVVATLDDALARAREHHGTPFVIGGERLYAEALRHPGLRRIHATEVFGRLRHDAVFPHVPTTVLRRDAVITDAETGICLRFTEQVPRLTVHPEQRYLDLVQRILTTGTSRMDRTGVGTLAVFGERLEFDLRNQVLPLLTTKRVFWRGVVEELLWFLRGDTDAGILRRRKVHIWDGNGTREFLDNRGLAHRAEGDLGPIYGFQWRHFGAAYQDCATDYEGQGVDQLRTVEQLIEDNPNSRRILLTAWNPAALQDMALPPCHVLCQFFVQDKYLSCQMYQRSADVFLGLPFNIASYALLTHILAHRSGLEAKRLVLVLGDAHLYQNHRDQALQQIQRTPHDFPTLRIRRSPEHWEDYAADDFEVLDYDPMRSIWAPMNV